MNEYLQAIILGVVEGLTEFLPVSSTGHMILVQPMIGVDPLQPTWKTMLWVSQLGAILAVVLYFWGDLWKQTFGVPLTDVRRNLLAKLVVAMVPTIGIALLVKDYAEQYLENPPAVGVALIVGAFAILLVDRFFRRDVEGEVADITLKQAFLIGVIQCVSMWSGISRSGATIMGGMALGLSPRVATQFSFYLAIPTMLAAGAKTLLDERKNLSNDGAAVVLAGTATAFVTALIVVATFLGYVRKHKFTVFAVYRVLLGAAVLTWYWSPTGRTTAPPANTISTAASATTQSASSHASDRE
ncbi:MAG: undecaprenyl-diphosphate phosphatase [Phycisphaerae bacterium]